MKPQLISFKICPFVQRSVIVLNEKQADYDITYINLMDPPAWFREISPLGKVPVLKVGEAVIFESAVIMEYLDEVIPPSMHPADPLLKAQNRAWIEFASSMNSDLADMVMASDEKACNQAEKTLREKLAVLEKQVKGIFFNGTHLALVDAAYAPLFMRIDLLEQWQPMGLLNNLPRCQAWSQALLARPSVQNSVVPELADLYRARIENSGGFGAQRFGAA